MSDIICFSSKDTLAAGAIVGIVIGVLILAVIIGVVLRIVILSSQKKKRNVHNVAGKSFGAKFPLSSESVSY